jgi:hypothetical protein
MWVWPLSLPLNIEVIEVERERRLHVGRAGVHRVDRGVGRHDAPAEALEQIPERLRQLSYTRR